MAMATANGGSGASGKKSTPKIKVSQSTINDIKKLGMTKSLKLAGMNAKAAQGGVAAEWNEGVRRMYGDRRFQDATRNSNPAAPKATKPTAPRYTSPDNARSGKTAPKYTSADSARRSAK
jgi:hypothetical protein